MATAQDVEVAKPIHTLRKEAGSIVATKAGIHAASQFLRHADIQVTSMHYADHKERVPVDIGSIARTDKYGWPCAHRSNPTYVCETSSITHLKLREAEIPEKLEKILSCGHLTGRPDTFVEPVKPGASKAELVHRLKASLAQMSSLCSDKEATLRPSEIWPSRAMAQRAFRNHSETFFLTPAGRQGALELHRGDRQPVCVPEVKRQNREDSSIERLNCVANPPRSPFKGKH